MSALPKKVVVDTNVPKTANLAVLPDSIPLELLGCACMKQKGVGVPGVCAEQTGSRMVGRDDQYIGLEGQKPGNKCVDF